MTESAQEAMRIIISDFASTTRFALACNESTKIIDPIQSRCVILRYTKLKEEEISARLDSVMENEKIRYDADGLKAILETSEGDMRHALNNLQSTYVGFGEITKDNVYKVVDVPQPEILENALQFCEEQEIDKALDQIDLLLDNGYQTIDIITSISRILENSNSIDESKRYKALTEISKAKEKNLTGINSTAQVYYLIARLTQILVKI